MPQFLYEQLDGAKYVGMQWPGVPEYVADNLNPAFVLREYQREAFGRFFYCYSNQFEGKGYPLHFLFNMATGSGKTLIMAGLMLYLYRQGYRNFLFFVHSTNIIRKTEDNFLNARSAKYLFADKIIFDNKEICVRQVENFEDANNSDINICFTTIQKMHGDLHNEKENSLTFEDFKDKKIVLLSDEAHHTQAATRQGALAGLERPNWENTVNKVFAQNKGNILLEFTATMDFMNPHIAGEYRNKVMYRYDLKAFRNDGFSKDPVIFASDTDKKDRILQALILNQYRQEVAGKYGINLKPVVLFKAQRTIVQSQENKVLFHKIIDDLSAQDIRRIRSRTNLDVLQKAFRFFQEHETTDAMLARKLKDGFAENKCMSVNDEGEKERNQLLLNSLEDPANQIRAIFAVQKLNEGWDVLNLFDIVRLYETRDAKDNKPGKTTIAEAQLVGRGARYFPFSVGSEDDRFRRKYDKDMEHEMRVLEELHYHCHPGRRSRYIDEIRTALIREGMMDDDDMEVELKLKESFKKGRFYRSGIVYANERVKTSFAHVRSLADLGVARRDVGFVMDSGRGGTEVVYSKAKMDSAWVTKDSADLPVRRIERHIVKNALAKNNFFSFANLKRLFPNIASANEFIMRDEYLGGLKIAVEGDAAAMGHEEKFQAVMRLLAEVEKEIKEGATEYKGTVEFRPKKLSAVFADKKIRVKKGSTRADAHADNIAAKPWYAYDTLYGTSEERDFVGFMGRIIEDLRKDFPEIYLIRNERVVKIYNFRDGAAFEPDYLLFLLDKKGRGLTYQIFIEPKGAHLREHDIWKNDFLKEITDRFQNKKPLEFAHGRYTVRGVPFYESENENEFREKLAQTTKR